MASRRSRATLSPTRTEVMLLPTAISVLSSEMPSISKEVWMTTFRLFCLMPWSMIRWIRRGMARSMKTSEVNKTSATTARRQ